MNTLPIYEWLRESSLVFGMLGEPSRIYRTVAPQDEVYPLIVWQVIAGVTENYIGERPGIDNAIVQIDVYGRDEEELDVLMFAVCHALEAHGHQRGVPRDMFEGQPSKTLRRMVEFSFWENRTSMSPN
jgi:hypothetical protein